MRFGLRARFILVISFVLFVLFGTIAFFLVRNLYITLKNDLNSSSKAFAQLATRPIGDAYNVYQSAGSTKVAQESQQFTGLDSNLEAIAIMGLDGKTLLDIKGHTTALTSGQVTSFNAIYITNQDGVYTQIIEPYLDAFGQHRFDIAYSFSTSELEATAARDAYTILIFAILGLLITAFVMYELVNFFFLRPIEEVSKLAVIVGNGDYSQQISVKRKDEIGDMATAVNQMANVLKADITKLQEVDKLKNEFIMIASHNLRTPLTIIKGYLDSLHESEMPEETRTLITAIETSSLSLSSFSEDMLTISSIEAGNSHVVLTVDTTIGEIFEPMRESFALLAGQKKVKLKWNLPDDKHPLKLSAWHTRNALNNIIANAIKFNHEDGLVTIDFSESAEGYTFTVSDTGIGIAADEIPKLFTKFHRGTGTLAYNYEGTGIGLYASKLVAETQGGHIEVSSEQNKGSVFTLWLPRREIATDSPTTEPAR